jgi:curved DNA-binding protein CbpA
LTAAYRALSKQYHPDHHPEQDGAANRMAQINASYELLINPQARARYDKYLDRLESRRKSYAARTIAPPDLDYPEPPSQLSESWVVPFVIAAVIVVVLITAMS